MRTVIILAIGIYIGRQLCKNFDRSRYQALMTPKLLEMLESHGVTKAEAEKQIKKVFNY